MPQKKFVSMKGGGLIADPGFWLGPMHEKQTENTEEAQVLNDMLYKTYIYIILYQEGFTCTQCTQGSKEGSKGRMNKLKERQTYE